jgi:hypothetical protein
LRIHFGGHWIEICHLKCLSLEMSGESMPVLKDTLSIKEEA